MMRFGELSSLKIKPSLSPKTSGQITQKPKTSDKKNIFFKNCLQSFPKQFQMTTFVVLIPKTYILGHLITLYCPCTLCARHIACTERARVIVATQTPIHICFRNQHYKCSHLALFWKRLETIFEKNIFFTQGSPLWFLGDLFTSFWAKGEFYF